MSIFKIFRSKKRLSASEESKLSGLIDTYIYWMKKNSKSKYCERIEENQDAYPDAILDKVFRYERGDRLNECAAHREALTELEEKTKAGYDTLYYRCKFYTAAISDILWMGKEENLGSIKKDFAELKNADPKAYEELRDQYWISFYEFKGINELGFITYPTNVSCYPGRIFPEGDPNQAISKAFKW